MALSGMYAVNIANFALNALGAKLGPFISRFATNVSDQMPEQGNAVDVPIVAAEAAAADLGDNSDDREHANISPLWSTTKKTVTLANKPARGFYVDPWEAAAAQRGVLVRSLDMKLRGCTNAIALSVVQAILNLVTAANFANSKTINPAAFDRSDLLSLRTQADGLKWGDDDGFVELNSAAWESLCGDEGILDKSASGADTLNTGGLPRLAGFDLSKNVQIPPAGGTPADENLVGLAALPSAIAVAMRPLSVSQLANATPQDFGLIDEIPLFDADTNVACTLSIWAKPNTKRVYYCVETWHGQSVAMTNQLIRLKTA